MGRGRAKAKQQKVARDLKYNTPEIDVSKLQEELGRPGAAGPIPPPDDEDDDEDKEWPRSYG
jgi:hypothetical protein